MFLVKDRKAHRLVYRFFWAFFISILGCSTGEIDNFANIRVESDYRLNRLDIQIALLDKNQNPLYWSGSILTPQIGVSALSESKIKTNAQIYSMSNGIRHAKVYDGRLIDLRWSRIAGTDMRLLLAEIPHTLIEEDKQRDTELGIITITLETDKQGPFSDTLENTRIYRSAP